MFTSYGTAAVLSVVIGPVTYFSLKYLFRDITLLSGEKVVIITGASSGLGRACAMEFYREGCQVVLCSRDMKKLSIVKNELVGMKGLDKNPTPLIIELDVSVEDSIRKAAAKIKSLFPNGIHILINNAGISYRGEVLSTVTEVDRKVMETNYFGHVAFTRALIPSMLKLPNSNGRTRAHIVSVNSVQGKISIPSRSSYAASKFACAAFFDCLRSEVADSGINVCSVFPGYMKTNLSLNAVTGKGTSYGKMDEATKSGIEPQKVAGKILDAVRFNKQEVYAVTLKQRLAIWLRVLLPFLYFWVMRLRAKSERR